MEELMAASDFTGCSVNGVLLQESHGSERTFPFPRSLLVADEKESSSSYPSIRYPDMLNMIFEADTIIS